MKWGYLVAKATLKLTGIWFARRKISAARWQDYIYY